MEVLGWDLNYLITPGARTSVMFQNLGAESPASVFWSRPLIVASMLLFPCLTEDKCPGLMLKHLSTPKVTHRIM